MVRCCPHRCQLEVPVLGMVSVGKVLDPDRFCFLSRSVALSEKHKPYLYLSCLLVTSAAVGTKGLSHVGQATLTSLSQETHGFLGKALVSLTLKVLTVRVS